MELDALHLHNLKYTLFARRRFLPMFLATFLGAFNDNLLRAGIIVMIAYSASHGVALAMRPEILITMCSALLVLPMIVFSSVAGQLADKCEKSRLVMYCKIAELFIMAAAAYGFATQHIALLMVVLFFSGTHTTFYVTIKFSILPQHLRSGELIAGNGFMAGGSYLAILLGMIAGGLLVELPGNAIGNAALGIAFAGFVASLCIPRAEPTHPEVTINFHPWHSSVEIIRQAWQDRALMGAILAISWFMVVGSVFVAQFANYAQGIVQADNQVYILFLTVFSVGVALGSLLCDTLLKGEISGRLLPFAALGISLFTFLMVALTPVATHEGLLGLQEFLADRPNWLVLGAMLMIALCGGVYMVPLYALLQHRANTQYRSRMIAVSNLSDSLCTMLAAIAAAVLLYAGARVTDLFLVIAILNLGVAWYARKLA